MQEDTRVRMAKLLGAIGVLLFVVVLTVVTRKERHDAREAGTVGTSGVAAAEAARGFGPRPLIDEVPALEPGRRVELRVKLGGRASEANAMGTFWVGAPDRRVLVVLNRDARTEQQRLEGTSPAQTIPQVQGADTVVVSGTVQTLFRREDMYSWGLTRDEQRALAERPLYIRADSVQPTF
jgi:hypothetical protein